MLQGRILRDHILHGSELGGRLCAINESIYPYSLARSLRIPTYNKLQGLYGLARFVFSDDGFIDGEGDSKRVANGFFHQHLFIFLSELPRRNVRRVDLSSCFDDETLALLQLEIRFRHGNRTFDR